MSLTEQEIRRYSRHIILPEVGGRGQKRLKAASVLLAGLGPAGSAAALYLAAAGVGTITLWDPGIVTPADLEAAIAHNRHRIGMDRARSARDPLAAINPDARIEVLHRESDVAGAVPAHQVVLASTGDWGAIQAEVIRVGSLAVFAAVHGARGAVMAMKPGSACLGCVPPEQAAQAGLRPEGDGEALAPAAGVVGVMAATEVVKLILAVGTPLTDRLMAYDGWEARFRERPLSRRSDCPFCGH